jgi:hypothetical protein
VQDYSTGDASFFLLSEESLKSLVLSVLEPHDYAARNFADFLRRAVADI